jgi:hypothetical protein
MAWGIGEAFERTESSAAAAMYVGLIVERMKQFDREK